MTKRANITLTDMLLFGAPGGKTEILDGWVDRVFVAKTPATARRVFQDLAREIAAENRAALAAKALASRTSYECGKTRLSLEAVTVTLSVRATVRTYARFANW